MVVMNRTCSVCGSDFELHFRYQVEQRRENDPSGKTVTRHSFYCSQRCLEASHRCRADGQVSCDACARRFEVELAAQVLFTGGRRHYACSPICRARVLEGVRAVRIGQLMDPGYPLGPAPSGEGAAPAAAALTPEPPSVVPVTPTPPSVLAATPPRGLVASAASAASPSSRPTPTPPSVVTPTPPSVVTPTPPPVSQVASRATAVPLIGRQEPSRAAPVRRKQVLAVFNHKGGTGKTTTAVHIAAGLAERGKRVLLVDTDGQGNVATSLGLKFERSLYHVIVMGLPFSDTVVSARPRLDVVPSNETLAAAELYLAGQRQRDRVLANRFAAARAQYDYVIVDCSPSLSLLNQNALVMADAVLCPVACDYLSLVGIQKVVRTVKQVNRLLSHSLGFWGVLPTFFDTRARICHEALDTLRGHFREVCLEPIRLASRVKEAPAHGKTLFEYAPTSSAAQDYLRVVDKLLLPIAAEPLTETPAPAQVAQVAGGAA